MSPQCHVIKVSVSTAPILIDVASITGYQCVRGRSSAIAVLYETHWNGNPCAWGRKLVFKPFPTISSHTERINKPIVSPATENINVCVLTQPGTRSPAPNVKSTSKNRIHSSLVLATVLASYPPLYILKPPVYIILHFMVSGGLVKTNNYTTSWDATSYGPSTIQAPLSSTSKNLPKIYRSTPSGAPGASKHPATPTRFEASYMGNHLAFNFPLSPCIIMTLLYVRPTLLCISMPRSMISTTSTAISTPKATLTVTKI